MSKLETDFKMSQAAGEWFLQNPGPQITCQPGENKEEEPGLQLLKEKCCLQKIPLKGVIPLPAYDVVK